MSKLPPDVQEQIADFLAVSALDLRFKFEEALAGASAVITNFQTDRDRSSL